MKPEATRQQVTQDTPETNTQIVKQAYAAFGRRDIPALLDLLAQDVDWFVPGTKEIPHAGRRKGRDQVAQFFATVDQAMDLQPFELRNFIAQDDKVVVLGYYSGRSKATGRNFACDWAMVFTVRNGKIVQFEEYTDTLNQAAAFRKT